MLTSDLLSQIEGLTDDQKKAIEQLSRNDENAVIGAKLKETHEKYDETFASIFGGQKPSSEKSYVYWAKMAQEASEKAQKAKGLETKVSDLETKLKSGASDTALKQENDRLNQALLDSNSKFSKLQDSYKKVEEEKQNAIAKAMQENTNLYFENDFNAALAGVKFKSGMPDLAIQATLELAKNKVKSIGKHDFIEKEGKKEIIFRNEAGLPITNPDNLQNELTAREAFLKEIAPIIDTGKEATGGGGSGEGGSGNSSVSIGQASTKSDAVRMIQTQLAERGITTDKPNFNKEFSKAYEENKVAEMSA